jgi:hypothetical protein
MRNFLMKMLSGNQDVSSKRVIGVISFILIILISCKILFSAKEHPNEILLKEVLYTLFLIIAATILGGTVENIMKRPSDVINQNGTPEKEKSEKNENQELS